MSSIFFIRSAGEGDLSEISRLFSRSLHATYDPLFGVEKVSELIAVAYSVERLREKLARPDSEFVVADDGHKLGGLAYAAMDPEIGDLVRLHQIYVDPQLLGQGIGKDLFAEIETCFPDARRMRLDVVADNLRAIAFYERLGFHKVGEDHAHGAGIVDAIALILEKDLAF